MRYAILYHRQLPLDAHWDLMVETPVGTLQTWRLLRAPCQVGQQLCHLLPPHRRIYLQYEGPISRNRGWVQRWDQGRFLACRRSEEMVGLHLRGQRLTGWVEIRRRREESWVYRYRPLPHSPF